MAGAYGSDDERGNNQNLSTGKSSHRVLSSDQKARLEAFFEWCQHPDEYQGAQLAKELSLEPKQIKFWFQNRRDQEKYENISNLLGNLIKMQLSQSGSEATQESVTGRLQCRVNREHNSDSSLSNLNDGDDLISHPTRKGEEFVDMGKARILEVATAAMDELLKLMKFNEPLWARSPDDDRFVLVPEIYKQMFPEANSFKSIDVREESSKHSLTINIGGMQLVEMFLDSDKWATLFPTIISKADTIKVLDAGLLGNRSGALQLMHGEMHVLSPLVPSREFFFLRYCEQVEASFFTDRQDEVDAWVITDVTFDSVEGGFIPLCPSRRLPSGCLIRETVKGTSTITWVEHVEMKDTTQTNWLYRDLVCKSIAYGAERWLMELQRTCNRIACFTNENIPGQEAEVITSHEGKVSLMNLSHRMVRSFCGVLNTSSNKPEFTLSSEANNSRVDLYFRRNTAQGQPNDIVVSVVSSIWLPVSPDKVFDLFRDENRRHEWDVLARGNLVCEVAHIPIGTSAGNCISILKPLIGSDVLIVQETSTDSLGSYIVYSPIDEPNMDEVARGHDSSQLPILPSGFMITGDAHAVSEALNTENVVRTGGSILTVAFQILISGGATMGQVNMGTVTSVLTLFRNTVQNIKTALNCI